MNNTDVINENVDSKESTPPIQPPSHALQESQALSKITAEGSLAVLRQMAMSDALNQTRSLNALKESAIGSMISEIPRLGIKDRLDLMEKINAASSIEAYTDLLEKTKEKTYGEVEDSIENAKAELELIKKEKELALREMELMKRELVIQEKEKADFTTSTTRKKGRPKTQKA